MKHPTVLRYTRIRTYLGENTNLSRRFLLGEEFETISVGRTYQDWGHRAPSKSPVRLSMQSLETWPSGVQVNQS
jgi:hypothetical protein